MMKNVVNVGDFDLNLEQFTNYARLIRLTVEEGTERVKEYVLSNLPGSKPLEVALNNKKHVFEKLKEKKVLNRQQYEQLFPVSNLPVADSNIDMSLWYVLARNLALNQPPVKFVKYEKSHGPTVYDQLPQHQVIRVRNIRNHLVHVRSLRIDRETFENLWDQLTGSLMALGSKEQTIQSYRTDDLDPMKTAQQYIRLREQVFVEYESLYKSELKRRKQLIGVIVAVAVVLVLVTMVTGYVLYLHAKTWSSCVHNLELKYTTSKVSGAVSYMPRSGWQAESPKGKTIPITAKRLEYVIVSHSAVSSRCSTTDDCCNMAQIVQKISMHHSHISDVAYNYMIGNDGVIYEGRGAGAEPAIAKYHNNNTIGIAFMGTYIDAPPTDDGLAAAQGFLQYLVDQEILSRNFTIYGLCQVRKKFPDAPGAALMDKIMQWHGSGHNTWSWRPGGCHCNNGTSSEIGYWQTKCA